MTPKPRWFFLLSPGLLYDRAVPCVVGVKLREPRLNALVRDCAEHDKDPEPRLVLHTC